MQAELTVKCKGCGSKLGKVDIDTATMPGELQSKVNAVILAHRADCPAYGAGLRAAQLGARR